MKLGDDTPQVKALLEDLKSAQGRGVESISIQFDSPEIKTHAKKILIDGKRLIIGSSNWTESAFGKNHESMRPLTKTKK